MSYNLLLDTKFDTNNWKLINCKIDNGVLTSSKKVFGIEQELILPDPTKLYYRVTYKILSPIKEVKIGLQNGSTLEIDKQIPKLNKMQTISLIDYAKQEKIKVHIIFESDKDINRVLIKEPMLCDLNHLHKATWLKIILDRVLKFRSGYQYSNLYKDKELLPNSEDFKDIVLEKAKIGSILKTKENIEVTLNAKFIKGNYYLVKLDFEEINRFGNIYFQYGVLKSNRYVPEQIYLVFQYNDDKDVKLYIDANDVLNYAINLKHILLIDITKMHLLTEDISYLPFI